MNNTIKNHYLPVTYLEGFCNNKGMIYTYDKHNLMKSPWPTKPENTGYEKKLYHSEIPEDNNKIENFFSNGIESTAAPILRRLREQKKFPKTSEERLELSLFLATLGIRSPTYLKHWQEQANKEFSMLGQFYQALEKDSIIPMLKDGIIELYLNRSHLLSQVIGIGIGAAAIYYNMHWALIETSDDHPFITCDNIINVYNPNPDTPKRFQHALAAQDNMVFMPISSQLALMMVNNHEFVDKNIFSVNKENYNIRGEAMDLKSLIDLLNQVIWGQASRFVFANNDKATNKFTQSS